MHQTNETDDVGRRKGKSNHASFENEIYDKASGNNHSPSSDVTEARIETKQLMLVLKFCCFIDIAPNNYKLAKFDLKRTFVPSSLLAARG